MIIIKIDYDLYAYLTSISTNNQTPKPSQTEMGKLFNITRQTVFSHLKILKEQGYLKEDKNNYYLNYSLPIQSSLLPFLYTTGTTELYLWLLQQEKPYFTIKQICAELQINYQKNSKQISQKLQLLKENKIIDFSIEHRSRGFVHSLDYIKR